MKRSRVVLLLVLLGFFIMDFVGLLQCKAEKIEKHQVNINDDEMVSDLTSDQNGNLFLLIESTTVKNGKGKAKIIKWNNNTKKIAIFHNLIYHLFL